MANFPISLSSPLLDIGWDFSLADSPTLNHHKKDPHAYWTAEPMAAMWARQNENLLGAPGIAIFLLVRRFAVFQFGCDCIQKKPQMSRLASIVGVSQIATGLGLSRRDKVRQPEVPLILGYPSVTGSRGLRMSGSPQPAHTEVSKRWFGRGRRSVLNQLKN